MEVTAHYFYTDGNGELHEIEDLFGLSIPQGFIIAKRKSDGKPICFHKSILHRVLEKEPPEKTKEIKL